MAESKMKEVAKILGAELNKPFKIKGYKTEFTLTKEYGLINPQKSIYNIFLVDLLLGKKEIEKPILDDVEKRYLENVLKPFKDKVNYLIKHNDRHKGDYIIVTIYEEDSLLFPYFKKNKMYKGMEVDKRYTLKELGLFED